MDPNWDYVNMSVLAVWYPAVCRMTEICRENVMSSFSALSSHCKLKSILVYPTLGGMRTSASYLQLQNPLDTHVSHQFGAWNLTLSLVWGESETLSGFSTIIFVQVTSLEFGTHKSHEKTNLSQPGWHQGPQKNRDSQKQFWLLLLLKQNHVIINYSSPKLALEQLTNKMISWLNEGLSW